MDNTHYFCAIPPGEMKFQVFGNPIVDRISSQCKWSSRHYKKQAYIISGRDYKILGTQEYIKRF